MNESTYTNSGTNALTEQDEQLKRLAELICQLGSGATEVATCGIRAIADGKSEEEAIAIAEQKRKNIHALIDRAGAETLKEIADLIDEYAAEGDLK